MIKTPEKGVLLYWGPLPTHWPPPLYALLQQDFFQLQPVDSLHDAAAHIAALGPSRIHALLLSPAFASASNTPALKLFRQYLPLFSLPPPPNERFHTKESCPPVSSWSEALLFFADYSPPNYLSLTPDNNPIINHEKIAVTSPIEPRYDDFDVQPLLSEQEMRALLGAPD